MSEHLSDILATGLAVIFCGNNPGLDARIPRHSFASPSNRFWTVMHLAGFTDIRLAPRDERRLLEYGCGLTTTVRRPTRRADEITIREFQESRPSLEERVSRAAPRTLAFLGKRAYSAMTGLQDVRWGVQGRLFAGTEAWVLPNPSGLNRNFTLEALVCRYTELRVALEASDPGLKKSKA